jgi:hypothetical protein
MFRKLMDTWVMRALKEGLFTDSMEVGIMVNGTSIMSHLVHQIWMHMQGSKHWAYLQDKNDWDNDTWNSIDWKGIKSGYPFLGPLKWIKMSKSMHGWLNTRQEKAKILLGEVTWTKDRCSKNLTRTRNIPPKCNKPVTTKQQTRFSFTSIN